MKTARKKADKALEVKFLLEKMKESHPLYRDFGLLLRKIVNSRGDTIEK